jgi:hypothetical protein
MATSKYWSGSESVPMRAVPSTPTSRAIFNG